MKKKIHMISALLAMLLPTMVFAGGSATFWAKVTLDKTTSSPSGAGLVYAYGETNNSEFKNPPQTFSVSQEFSDSSTTPTSGNVVMNLSAKANYGYKFDGWYTDAAGTMKYDKTSVSMNSSATEKGSAANGGTYYAKFISNPDSCTLTLNKPEGLASYTVTAPSGFPANLSQGGSATVYKGDQYSFKYTLSSDEYDFINWTVNGEQKTGNPVSVTISGDTTVVLTLKKKVTCTATCQGSVGGTYKANNTPVSSSDQTLSNFGSITVNLSNPVANDGYAFYGWYILHPNGVKEYLSYYTSVSTGEKKENITIGAEFREVQDCKIDFIAPVDGKITYAISGGNSGAVEGANVSETVPAGANVTLTATSDFGSRRAKWYTKDDRNRKTYFSIDNSLTKTFASSVAVGVDFIPVNTNIVNAIEAAQSSATQEAILTADAEIVLGTSVEIPAGITIDLNGHTLYVDGTLTVNGVLTGGTVSKCTKLIRQTGNGLEPIVADNISYWDTRVVSSQASVSGFSNTASHLTIVNGYGTPIRGALSNSSPEAIVCDIDLSGTTVNTITNFVADYSQIKGDGGAIIATGGANKLVVQLVSSFKLRCSSTASQTDFPSDSGWQATKNSQPNGKLGKGFRIDCAHNSIELTYEFTNASTTYIINAESASRTSGLLLSATENFINCKTVSQRINASNASYTAKFNIYDCGNPSITFDGSTTFSGDNCGVNFRSGGPYTIPSSGNSNYHVFGGFYTSKPDTGRIAKGISGRAFYQHADTYWYLDENLDKNVAEIGGIKKYALIEAFQEAITGDVSATTITLLRDCSLDEPVVIPADRSIRLELAGCTVTAPNGFIVNHGSFEIGDKYGSLTYCGVVTETGNVFVNEDGGRIVVAYGKYDGGVLLKAGSEFTTHHGNFTGAISFGEGVAVKASVAKIYGGKFSTDVADCLCDGYQQVNGYVGLFPYADIQDQSVSGYEFGYQVQAMADRDLGLYNNSQTMRDASYTAENWFRRAQLYSQSAPYLSYSIDCVISFDRGVTNKTITAYGKTTIGFPRDLPEDVAAGVDYRVLSKELASRDQYQKSYSQFLTEDSVKTLVCAVKNNKSDNNGTFCRLRVDLCSGANRYDVSNLKSIHTIGHRCFVFGADSNVAMIRPETGAATFYATLEDAMDAVANGGTVMLANDNTAPLKLEKAGTYTFDTMGFKHSGGVELGEGLSIKSETPVTSSVATLIPDAVATRYVVVAESAATAVDVPTAVSGLVYDGTEKTGVEAGTGYTLSGNTATAAGSYTATATLEEGYVWSDDSSDAKEISWSIGKASLTATAENKSVVRGATVQYAIAYSGFVNGEDASALTAAPTVSCDYVPSDFSATATSYTISLSGGSAANYELALVSGTLTVTPSEASIGQGGDATYVTSISEVVSAAEAGTAVSVTLVTSEPVTVDGMSAGKTLTVTPADGVTANVTVNPADGAFIDTTTDGNTTTYESKKITVEMATPQTTVEVKKIDHGTESAVTDATEINAAVTQLMGNNDVPRTDNTDKLDVLDKITVTPTKIVEEVVESKTVIRSATFDVVPAFIAGQSLAEGQKLKFRLPVDATATQLSAIVYHDGAQFGAFAVQTYNNEKYVEVESADFSPYGYDLLDGETDNPVVAIGTTGYATFAEAIEAANAANVDEITILNGATESPDSAWKVADGKLVRKTYVAQIGTTKYETLAEAVAAVPTDGTATTITMIAGETIAADAGITIAAGKNIVLDLNGQTVQMAAASADERWLIKNEGTLTVKDSAENGKLLMSATGQASTAVHKSTIKNMGALTVESGTIELTYSGTNKEEPTVIMNDASDRATSLTVKGGTVVNSANRGMGVYLAVNDTNATVLDVQGGRVEGYGAAVRYYFDDRNLTDAKLTFNMSNGTIHGRGMYGIHGMTTSSKDWNGISFDISGGTISCVGLLGRKHVISPLQGAVSISGGTFNGDVYIYGHDLEITDGDFAGSVTLHRTKESLESASISGGQFISGLTIAETTADNTTNPYYNAKFITGGIYGTAPEARNVVDEYAVVDNTDSSTQGDYPKTIGGAVASVVVDENTTYYATLADAIAAANEAGVDEITILNGATESPDADWKVSDGKLVRKDYVAQIVRNDEVVAKYESLASALEAAQSGDTVQLLADVEGVTETFELHGKNITIDGQGSYSITAGANTEPRSVVQSYGGARNMFVVLSGNVTFKGITLDGGDTHYYTFLVQAKNGTTTFDNVSLLHGGEADSSGTAGVGYGAAVQVDGATVLVTNSFYACTGTNVNDVTTGVFPFTALLYQSGGIHFDDGVTAGIGDDLLLVGMVGAVDVSTDEGRAQVNEMLGVMNVPAGYYPYTLKLGDSEMTSFTGASPLGWNGIIDYGKQIMVSANTSMGMDMNPATTPVEVGLLTDTLLPEVFTFEDANLTVNGNGNALAGTIEYTDNAGLIEDIVLGTEDNPLVLDMTGLGEGNAIHLGSDVAATSVIIKVTEGQATSLGHAIVTWDAAHETEEEAASLETGIVVEIVDAQGEPILDPETNKPKEASVIWDLELGLAYIGPCEARLTGPTHPEPIYTTLADAIARAAQTGDTVTLLMDIANVS
ncbi:MAG: InlB B-repeat-containing protein, partial [Kiritimatiellae bacterium]|nr:InlB B-repeat-containing protein [Kiritimatiellia bacterium]